MSKFASPPSKAAGAAAGSAVPINYTEALQSSFADVEYHSQIKKGLQLFPIPSGQFKKILAMSFGVIENSGMFPDLLKEELINNSSMGDLFFGVYYLVLSVLRTRAQDKKVTEDLKSFGVSVELIKEFITAINDKRSVLEGALKSQVISLPNLSKLEWRVDVTISTRDLQRVFKPSVLFQLTTSDGKVNTFECSLETFHAFRFNVASLLAAQQNLEQHPTLTRIQG